MFQAYKMKFKESINGTRFYIYKNCSVGISRVDDAIMVSICPHGFPKAVLPEQEEIDGLLSHMGIDPTLPYDHDTVSHIGERSMGDTNYYIQNISA